jgi:hypothetical protein
LETDRPQYDPPAACVIAQAIYFATFVSLRFLPRQKKFDARLKDVISIFHLL